MLESLLLKFKGASTGIFTQESQGLNPFMTETTLEKQPIRRFDLQRMLSILLHPRQTFLATTAEARPTWLTPMLLLSLTAFLVVLVSGYLRTRAAMLGEIPLPPDWQYWTPDMQNKYMQAQQLTQGKVFTYVIPLVGAWSGLWASWIILAGLLHLGSTLLGGRGSMQNALNVVAWASLPFAVRDMLRIIFMSVVGHAIASPGLSGFAASAGFFSQLLARLDIFLLWNIILLIIGFAISEGLPRGKALIGVVAVVILMLVIQSGSGALIARLSGTVVQRPL